MTSRPRIAFTRRAGTASDVCLLTLATSAVVCTDTPAENEDYLAWSDSGLYLAYVSDADGENDIYKHALSGGGFGGSRVNLTHRAGTDGNDDHPDWHGDPDRHAGRPPLTCTMKSLSI